MCFHSSLLANLNTGINVTFLHIPVTDQVSGFMYMLTLKMSLDVIFFYFYLFLPYWSPQSVCMSRLTEVLCADFRCVTGSTPSWPRTLQSCCVTQESTCSLIWWLPLKATTWVWCCPLNCPHQSGTSSRTSCPNWQTWESRWVSPWSLSTLSISRGWNQVKFI